MSVTIQGHYDRSAATVTGNKTLTAADSGIVQNVTVDNVIVTLPSTALGLNYIIRNGGSYDGKIAVFVSPAAADGITGNGFTAAVNKDAINTKLTSKTGDEICIMGTGAAGVTGWVAQQVTGTWAREA
jgi:hypothetical protein